MHESVHTEKSFRNHVNANQIWIIINLFRLVDDPPIGIPIGVLNLSEKGKNNPNLIWVNMIPKRFLCVWRELKNNKLTRTGKTPMIRGINLSYRDASLRPRWNPLYHHSTIVLRGLRGPFIGYTWLPKEVNLSDNQYFYFFPVGLKLTANNCAHGEKHFLNLVHPNRIWIVIYTFQMTASCTKRSPETPDAGRQQPLKPLTVVKMMDTSLELARWNKLIFCLVFAFLNLVK